MHNTPAALAGGGGGGVPDAQVTQDVAVLYSTGGEEGVFHRACQGRLRTVAGRFCVAGFGFEAPAFEGGTAGASLAISLMGVKGTG
jgi:hypothetical protein